MLKHRKEIFAIAIPAIITNITTPLLGLVDIAITGHIGDAVYIAAISLGGTVFNMLYWLLGFLRMGSSGLTAQAYGAGDRHRESIVLYRALISAALLSTLLIATAPFSGREILSFMDAGDSAQTLAIRYFSICIWGAPAVLTTYALSGWFLGLQNSRTPMWMAIITNTVNIAVSLTLVIGFDMRIEGVATGTTVAQWAGALFGLYRAFSIYRPRRATLREIADIAELRKFFSINSDIFLRTACLIAVTVWFTHAGARQGVDTLAANTILLQFFMLFSYFMDGFAFSGEALCGKYFGRGKMHNVSSVVKDMHHIGLVLAAVFSIVYFVGGRAFITLLTSDSDVVATASGYVLWVVVLPLCGYLSFLWDGIMIGLTATRKMLVAMTIAMVAFFSVYALGFSRLGNDGLWLAFNIYLLLRGLAQRLLMKNI